MHPLCQVLFQDPRLKAVDKTEVSGTLHSSEGETVMQMDKVSGNVTCLKRRSGEMGEGRLLGEGGSEASQEVASAQTPEGSEGRSPQCQKEEVMVRAKPEARPCLGRSWKKKKEGRMAEPE